MFGKLNCSRKTIDIKIVGRSKEEAKFYYALRKAMEA